MAPAGLPDQYLVFLHKEIKCGIEATLLYNTVSFCIKKYGTILLFYCIGPGNRLQGMP